MTNGTYGLLKIANVSATLTLEDSRDNISVDRPNSWLHFITDFIKTLNNYMLIESLELKNCLVPIINFLEKILG